MKRKKVDVSEAGRHPGKETENEDVEGFPLKPSGAAAAVAAADVAEGTFGSSSERSSRFSSKSETAENRDVENGAEMANLERGK